MNDIEKNDLDLPPSPVLPGFPPSPYLLSLSQWLSLWRTPERPRPSCSCSPQCTSTRSLQRRRSQPPRLPPPNPPLLPPPRNLLAPPSHQLRPSRRRHPSHRPLARSPRRRRRSFRSGRSANLPRSPSHLPESRLRLPPALAARVGLRQLDGVGRGMWSVQAWRGMVLC